MTQRLYYNDPYLDQFAARVVEQFPFKDRFAVVLDQTAFYPSSGGQPFDRGALKLEARPANGADVVDVLVREADDAVLHVLDAPLAGRQTALPVEVTGEIDWNRRFDHMQQHTGQHILSQAFLQVAQAETVSFHLGAQSATIDLADAASVLAGEDLAGWMEQVESLANRIVWENRPVTVQTVSSEGWSDLPLRKPPAVGGAARVVQVEGFDWSACGGTHVARTGEIGLIKIVGWEKRGDETRVEFLCGRRALQDYGRKNHIIHQVAAGFSVGYWELDQAVERLEQEAKAQRARVRELERTLAHYRAAELRAAAPRVAGVWLVVQHLPESSADVMRELARQLVSEPGVVALLGLGEEKAQFCFARSSDVDLDMVPLVRGAANKLGAPRGGGRPDFAQGGGPLADVHQMEQALDWAAQSASQALEKRETDHNGKGRK